MTFMEEVETEFTQGGVGSVACALLLYLLQVLAMFWGQASRNLFFFLPWVSVRLILPPALSSNALYTF